MENPSMRSRIKNAWNAFFNKDPTDFTMSHAVGEGSYRRPDRTRLKSGNERTIITSIFNRMAVDVSTVDIRHVRLDDNKRYLEEIDSGLNNCLSLEANVDQTGKAFIIDAVMSMLDEGTVALVPTHTDTDPELVSTGGFDIDEMRVCKILEWYPAHVKVKIYNEYTGREQQMRFEKRNVAIVENPFYSVMNEPNSTLQRLIRKLRLLDIADEQIGSEKLDVIIQLPFSIRSEARMKQAEKRKEEIVNQLRGSRYGIAYIDASEKVTQLNRPVENSLLSHVEYLTSMLYSQLGITQGILDGTADEKTILNYQNRTIEPILSAFADEMKRKFLTKTARSQKQSIMYFRDPFKLVPVSDMAEIADKMTRNEIMTSNEVRQCIGMKPSDDPNADVLRNKNLSEAKTDNPTDGSAVDVTPEDFIAKLKEEENQNE